MKQYALTLALVVGLVIAGSQILASAIGGAIERSAARIEAVR